MKKPGDIKKTAIAKSNTNKIIHGRESNKMIDVIAKNISSSFNGYNTFYNIELGFVKRILNSY